MRRALSAAIALGVVLGAAGADAAKPAPVNVSELVAVLEPRLGAGVPASVRGPFAAALQGALVRAGAAVVDRAHRDAILSEQHFQCSDATAPECRVEVGRLLGVRRLVATEIARVEGVYFLAAQLVDVETGIVLASSEERTASKAGALPDRTGAIARRLLGKPCEDANERECAAFCNDGDAASCLTLAAMYLLGRGVQQDGPRGVELLEQRCRWRLDGHACGLLASAHETGHTGRDATIDEIAGFYEDACGLAGAADDCAAAARFRMRANRIERLIREAREAREERAPEARSTTPPASH